MDRVTRIKLTGKSNVPNLRGCKRRRKIRPKLVKQKRGIVKMKCSKMAHNNVLGIFCGLEFQDKI